MKYIDEFRNSESVQKLAAQIQKITTQPWRLMEVCGGQTHSIVKNGLDQILPPEITLIHGPGCPVCVTPLEQIDKALQIAKRPEVIFCSFGDMLRVPGSDGDLFRIKAGGGDIRIVYSPLDAVRLAKENPEREVVFFAVGFETTAPANAMAVFQADKQGLKNFSVLVSHVLVPPAIQAVMSSPDTQVNGFLAAGHVCTIMGMSEYHSLADQYKVPIVVTGFEPVDILKGILACVQQLESKKHLVENQYARIVKTDGNPTARKIVDQVFSIGDRSWRGIGMIPQSGLHLSEKYASFNAETKFGVSHIKTQEPSVCISGLVLQGVKKPSECPAFGKTCTPEKPLGATMVSGEGACSAYYRYRRNEILNEKSK